MSDLTDFLLARIAEDEAVARAASPSPWHYGDVASVAGGSLYDKTRMIGDLHYEQPGDHDGSIVRHLLSDEADANGAHIARHDPARILAECEAKRRIVRECKGHETCGGGYDECSEAALLTLRHLATIHADHPDYREEWRP